MGYLKPIKVEPMVTSDELDALADELPERLRGRYYRPAGNNVRPWWGWGVDVALWPEHGEIWLSGAAYSERFITPTTRWIAKTLRVQGREVFVGRTEW